MTTVFGGGKRDRTADLLHAMQALSQLSYTPKQPLTAHRVNFDLKCQLNEGAILKMGRVIVNAFLPTTLI